MAYSIRIKASAERALRKLERRDRMRLVAAIDRLAEEPHAGSVLKGEYSGLRRLRVGRFRIVYEARDQELLILVVRVRPVRTPPAGPRPIGKGRGQFHVSEEFFEPLPADLVARLSGASE